MAGVEVKSLDSPEETRPFVDKGQAEVVNIGGGSVMRGTFEPGWRWSERQRSQLKVWGFPGFRGGLAERTFG